MSAAARIALLALVHALVAICLAGCASGEPVPTPSSTVNQTRGVTLELYARDADKRESYYRLGRDGTLAWGGGRDAMMRSTSWSGPMLPDEIDQLLALLAERHWFEAKPKSTRQPKGQFYELLLTHQDNLRTRRCTGRWEAIEPIERLLHDASLRRLEHEIQALPRAGLIEREKQVPPSERAPATNEQAPESSNSAP